MRCKALVADQPLMHSSQQDHPSASATASNMKSVQIGQENPSGSWMPPSATWATVVYGRLGF